LILSGVSKTAYYYEPVLETEENLLYMGLLDREYTAHPFYGSRRMTVKLQSMGYPINRKRVVRLMRKMGIEAIYPKPNLSKASQKNIKYPYLLKDLEVVKPNQVWSTDITYIPVKGGFLYLMAIIDWYSRYVVAWRLSNSLDVEFCLEALKEALQKGRPSIFNSDQGVQFTSKDFKSAECALAWMERGGLLITYL
jgi:putative transposase